MKESIYLLLYMPVLYFCYDFDVLMLCGQVLGSPIIDSKYIFGSKKMCIYSCVMIVTQFTTVLIMRGPVQWAVSLRCIMFGFIHDVHKT